MDDEAELRRLYDAHAASLFGYVLNLTRDETETRDAIQDLFGALARKPALLDGVRNERAFLLRMAHNALVDLARRDRARRCQRESLARESVDLFQPAADPDVAALRGELESALAGLPPEQRGVVHLKLWEGMTFESIAETLGISPNTAASRYRYGIDKVRLRLRPLYDEIK